MRLPLALALLLVLALLGCGGDLGAPDVRKEAEAVASSAAEGALVARQLARDGVTAPFVRAHADALAAAVGREAEKLAPSRIAPDAREDAREVREIALRLEELLAELASVPAPGEARALAAELERADRAARELAGS